MKIGLTLVELAAEILRRKDAKKDFYVIPAEGLRMHSMDWETGPHEPKLFFGEKGYSITQHAHNQIADYLDIPRSYYKRMQSEAPELLARNVNQWLMEQKKTRMIRTLDERVRAILSDGYRRMENEDLADAVLPVLDSLNLDIMSMQITDTRLYIKAVDPAVTREIKKLGGTWGQGHTIVKLGEAMPAITISNSETGDGRLSVLGGLYQDWCTNLASFGERSVKKTHLGARHPLLEGEELFELLSDETKRKTDEALWAQVQDTVRAIFDKVRFEELVDKVEGSQEDAIEGSPVKVVKLVAKKYGLDKTVENSVLHHLVNGGSLSRFGLYNAVTRASQDVESYDEATRMESIGGRIIELPKTEWGTLAKAA
jgi:hypothetical protein